jgi:hypothetical protein
MAKEREKGEEECKEATEGNNGTGKRHIVRVWGGGSA